MDCVWYNTLILGLFIERRPKMRTVTITIGLVVLLMSRPVSALNEKYFYSSGQILQGETWDDVIIYNDNTVVDMLGGQIGGVSTHNISTFNFSVGQITRVIDIGPLGTTNISDGTASIGDFVLDNDSYGLISGGSITAGRLKMYDDAIIDIRGGLVQFSSFDMAGVVISTVNIYGYDFKYSGNVVSGYLSDGNPFSIGGVSQSEFQRFNLIPEPSILLLLGIGGLLIRKRN
jgi:hypothetical protein